MKPIRLTEEAKESLLNKFLGEFIKKMDEFTFNMNDTTISFKTDINEEAKDKVTILFSQEAYLRMQALVDYFDTEVGWYGLVDKIDDKLYRIYDVKVCKQTVNGTKVDTDDNDTLEFFNSLTDDEADHLHYQAHSHVNMSTGASGIDLQNQADVVKNMGKTGFYIFQIWNKKNDISTYLYDLDNNVFYDSKDVYVEVEDALGTTSDFLMSVQDLVVEKKYYPYQKEKEKISDEPSYLPGYWGGNYSRYGDW